MREETVSEDRILIECPECRKEFSLNPVHVQGKLTARFQCSDCHTVFTVDFEDDYVSDGESEVENQSFEDDLQEGESTYSNEEFHQEEEQDPDMEDIYTEEELLGMPEPMTRTMTLSTKQTGVLAAIPVFLILILAGLGYSYYSEPAIANSKTSLSAGLTLNGLDIRDAGNEQINGLNVISGRIANQAGVNFREVIIEGTLYDKKGNFINSARFRVTPDLGNSESNVLNFGVLSENELEDLAGSYILRPGESLAFSMPLVSPKSIKPGFFSSRIVSAQAVQ